MSRYLDLVYEIQEQLNEHNLGMARDTLNVLSGALYEEEINKQRAAAAENTQKIKDALAAFKDKTPDEIARDLAKQGHRGVKGNSRNCPMARYLSAHDGAVSVSTHTATFDDGYIPLDDNVTAFVRNFDHGEYPSLDEDRFTSNNTPF